MSIAVSLLGEEATIIMGQSPPGESYNKKGKGAPLLNGPTEFGPLNPIEKQWTTSPTKFCDSGDVLFCVRGATAGRINLADKKYCLGRGLAAIRGKPGRFDNAFLRHVLTNGYATFQTRGVGSTFINISGEELANFKVPTLPVAKQRRLADILDKAEALRAQRRQALSKLDALIQSLFIDLFGDAVTNPKGWPISRVGDVAHVQGGLQVTTARKNLPREVPYLRVANVYRGFLDLSEIKMIRATDAEIARTKLVNGDLLIVEGHGNPSEIGRGALWDSSIPDCIHQNHIIRARFSPAKIVPLYACEYLNSPGGRRHLLRAGKTTSGLNTISVSEVRGTPIALPPIELQVEFDRQINAVAKLKMTQRTSLARLDALFATLQHRAFRGEL